MQDVMRIIMDGSATPAQIGAFLAALHIKGETVDELTGAATVMRDYAAKVEVSAEKVVDTVGTGGDAAGLFNVSTAAAFVAAAGGAVVAKHGNRAATGKSGSADVLEAAGVNIALSPGDVARTIEAVGIGFMFAPTHHGATRHAVGPRREIGVRSIVLATSPGDSAILTPAASSTSALPDLPVAARLPCLATTAPPAAATNAAAVETLNSPAASPPVPTVSTTFSAETSTFAA
jgi:anthranilate phosphoribosyltransferase